MRPSQGLVATLLRNKANQARCAFIQGKGNQVPVYGRMAVIRSSQKWFSISQIFERLEFYL
jgi:hypothetical protein